MTTNFRSSQKTVGKITDFHLTDYLPEAISPLSTEIFDLYICVYIITYIVANNVSTQFS